MKEGEPVLGGPQAAPGSTAASNVGPQPINPAAPPAPSSDFSSFQSSAQPNTQPLVAPSQSISPARPQSVPRLTNRFSDRATLNQSPQAPLINNTPQNMQFTPPNPQLGGYAPDIMSSPAPQPQKSKKAPIIILICLVLLAVGATIALAVTNMLGGNSQSSNPSAEPDNTPLTKQEVYDILWDFNAEYYSKLIETYSYSIGLNPDFKMSGSAILFPAESYANTLQEKVNNAIAAYDDILPELPDQIANDNINLSEVKLSISNSLQAIKQNADLINKFYNAYIAPLIGDSRPSTCSKTSAMSNLEQGDTAEAANKYYILYCDALDFIGNIDGVPSESEMLDLQQLVATPASEAASSLNNLLVDVPSANDAIDDLFKELTK